MVEPAQLSELGRRFWYGWGIGTGTTAAAVVASVWLMRPTNAWLVGVNGLLAVVFVAFSTTDLALGNRLTAAGNLVTASGLLLVGWTAATGFPENLLYGAFAVVASGSVIALYADHGHRVRAALAR